MAAIKKDSQSADEREWVDVEALEERVDALEERVESLEEALKLFAKKLGYTIEL